MDGRAQLVDVVRKNMTMQTHRLIFRICLCVTAVSFVAVLWATVWMRQDSAIRLLVP